MSLLPDAEGDFSTENWASSAVLSSVAIRVYRLEAMVGFYQEAFGIAFSEKRVGDITTYFGMLGDIMFKLYPLQEDQEMDEWPTHQLGFFVADLDAVLELSLKYGGSILNEPVTRLNQVHAAIRDPDGNSLELYSTLDGETERQA